MTTPGTPDPGSIAARDWSPESAPALVRLMTWSSPGFPVGAYSYSHGIEKAVDASLVTDRSSLADWIEMIVRFGAGRTDAAFLANAMARILSDDGDGFLAVAGRAAALRGTAELALESLAQGRAFVDAVEAAWPNPRRAELATRLREATIEPVHPIAMAMAAATDEVPVGAAVAAYLQAFAANLVSAGVRLIPLGQTDGLRVLAALEPAVHDVTVEAQALCLDEIGSAALMVDWTSMAHERQYTRLFRS